MSMEEKEVELNAVEARLDKEYAQQKEVIRLRKKEFMDNKLMIQRFADQAPKSKFSRKAVSDFAIPADFRNVQSTGYYSMIRSLSFLDKNGGMHFSSF